MSSSPQRKKGERETGVRFAHALQGWLLGRSNLGCDCTWRPQGKAVPSRRVKPPKCVLFSTMKSRSWFITTVDLYEDQHAVAAPPPLEVSITLIYCMTSHLTSSKPRTMNKILWMFGWIKWKKWMGWHPVVWTLASDPAGKAAPLRVGLLVIKRFGFYYIL